MSSSSTLRLSGVVIPPHVQIWSGLTKLFGIGKTTALKICASTNTEPMTKVKDVTENQIEHIRSELSKLTIEGDLRRQLAMNIKRIIDLKCYRGLRHIRKLPVRGQRTKTNAKTRKGKKR